ncbi:MAG TPA: M23 family metallopeptidase, partial [Rubrobacter sp.]|nr:M23 family metallopeptidase [Rubrobacter sp.]
VCAGGALTQSPPQGSSEQPANDGPTATSSPAVDDAQGVTPIVGEVRHAPVPFAGSDGRTHLVYELAATNYTGGKTTIKKLKVIDADTGLVVEALGAKGVAKRLQPAGLRSTVDAFAPSMAATIFLHVIFEEADRVPDRLVHRLVVEAEAAPPDQRRVTEKVAPTDVDRRDVAVVGPPLRGKNFVAADSCCDATRHTRAVLPINGQVWLAQRYAVDYEQLDAGSRFFRGEKEELENWKIYGKKALAVADGTVVKVIDGLPEQVPGVFPENIGIEEADGNAVILDIGGGNHALYAHFQPGSIPVEEGDRVQRGQVLGLVGNSGNSLAPHLHFHVMSTPLALASNGLPYEVDSFTLTGQTPGTEAFDEAEDKGTPLEVTPIEPPKAVTDAMPLDQNVVRFE